ncbi:MerR family transcriptional regulator [Virgibacillus halodenitrificans]|uniref:MerR family transcriptional regulator n=1 Tax=Virgibacillus halodenitrificans TaxID=1482 RepID=UPI001969DB09|nr:MerR family DNA-binding transcriptional regulator [Virgibacillus halodenitrificans]MCG1027074.1 MerR family DNA-binding transcriptional regulator [Virgibacillus halodenitrificans]
MKTIAEVAAEFDVTTRTIRYYEEIGLLVPGRTAGNRRVFSKSDVARLKLIFRGKRYGFSLEEIKEMILLFDEDRSGKKQLKRTIEYGEEKVAEIEEVIAEFQALKAEMEVLLEQFKQKLKDEGEDG